VGLLLPYDHEIEFNKINNKLGRIINFIYWYEVLNLLPFINSKYHSSKLMVVDFVDV
jgi:hypothetical protein